MANTTLSREQKWLEKESVFLKSGKRKREEEIKQEMERLKKEMEQVFNETKRELEAESMVSERNIWVAITEQKALRTALKIGAMLATEIPVHYIVVRLIH